MEIQQANVRENKKLQAKSELTAWKLNTQFKYLAKDAPQYNQSAELVLTKLLQEQGQ